MHELENMWIILMVNNNKSPKPKNVHEKACVRCVRFVLCTKTFLVVTFVRYIFRIFIWAQWKIACNICWIGCWCKNSLNWENQRYTLSAFCNCRTSWCAYIHICVCVCVFVWKRAMIIKLHELRMRQDSISIRIYFHYAFLFICNVVHVKYWMRNYHFEGSFSQFPNRDCMRTT